ncbi:Phosphoglucomutase-3 [Coelomomyces lativittatus]|nr:Phosphoglucomutase-3 [Coelomomyces lativittatus]KAJ1513250.1 Phosphoglucomutase-3 [Coelomomyces lativittatus]KAJ1517332.1 Phosphoglucomutase-3 [Coelomomyces lativittatus]
MLESRVTDLAQEWIQLDKNPRTLREMEGLLAEKNMKELAKRLTPRISFGTAGLRSSMEAGFARINDLTVIQASQGVAAYFLQENPTAPSVVIGFDHRERKENGLSSKRFARLTAAVFLKKGFKVYLFKNFVHTPMVPFGVTKLKATCGIMITASHNPKNDNGYKLYASNGCLIIPPMDLDISSCIEKNLIPIVWDEFLIDSPEMASMIEDPSATLIPKYLEAVADLTLKLRPSSFPKLRYVYTPLHGVADKFFKDALLALKANIDLITVDSQAIPDPEFPTVTFPNPEEANDALKIGLQHGLDCNANYLIANDPDGDRFVAAELLPDKTWHIFTGDQLGILFAEFARQGFQAENPNTPLACLCTSVSSKMLIHWGKKKGIRVEETLTGFKWLSNYAERISQEGYKVIFCYEEAIGFMFHPFTDKDGISAAIMFIELAAKLKNENKTVRDFLYDLYREYGCFVSHNSYLVSPSSSHTRALFNLLREPNYPTHLGSYTVLTVRDFTLGYDSTTKDHKCSLPKEMNSNAITFTLQVPSPTSVLTLQSCRITLRASGTEPKIKYYIEIAAFAETLSIDEIRSQTMVVLKDIAKLCEVQWLNLTKVA